MNQRTDGVVQQSHSIGNATSAGCIRMFHQDVIELETLVRSGAEIVVLTEDKSAELRAANE